jgi:hypothetical protein
MGREKVCSFCGSPTHTAFLCSRRRHAWDSHRKTPLRRESKVHNQRRSIVSRTWFIENPPDESGGYICYLQLSASCPTWVSKNEVTLEHVYPKKLYPELRYLTINIKPACEFCNKLKGSNRLESLVIVYPKLHDLLTTPEWLAWETEVTKFIKPELH